MILNKLSLHNFRQFYGDQSITFSTVPEKNVTVILGNNSFGKSTLLNAIHWVLYGAVQKDFDKPDELLSTVAQRHVDYTVWVELTFTFDEIIFILKRQRVYTFSGNGRTDFSDDTSMLSHDPRTGRHTPVDQNKIIPIIQRAVPAEMADAFFFEGENRAKQMQLSNHSQVSNAIRRILGCHFIEVVAKDLQKVAKKLDRNIGDQILSTDKEKDLYRHIESLENNLEDQNEKLNNHREKISEYEKKEKEIEMFLINNANSKKTQELIEKNRSELKKQEVELNRVDIELKTWLSRQGYFAITQRLCNSAVDNFEEEELKGRVPSEYEEDFIKGLIESEKCICGRALCKGSDESKHIESLLGKSTHTTVIDSAIEAKTQIKLLEKGWKKSVEELNQLETKRSRLNVNIARFRTEIEGLEAQIKDSSIEEINRKAKEKISFRNEISKLNIWIGDLSRKIKQETEPALELAKKQRAKLEENKPALKKRALIRDLATQLSTRLSSIVAQYEGEARGRILNKVDESVKHMHNDYEAFFDDDFTLGLRNPITKIELPRSTGENQMLTLAFTGALIKECAERAKEKQALMIPGTVAPLVLDSPYGKLDSHFQTSVNERLPQLAQQLVLLVSDTQANQLYSSKAKDKIGASFRLVRIMGESEGKQSLAPYKLGGKEYTSWIQGTDGYTRILGLED